MARCSCSILLELGEETFNQNPDFAQVLTKLLPLEIESSCFQQESPFATVLGLVIS